MLLVILAASSVGLPAFFAWRLVSERDRSVWHSSAEAFLAVGVTAFLEAAPEPTEQIDAWIMRVAQEGARVRWAGVFDETGEGLEFRRRIPLPLDFTGLWQLATMDRPEHRDEPWQAPAPPRLVGGDGEPVDVFAAIRRGDILVHHPYDDFEASVEQLLAVDGARVVGDPDELESAIREYLEHPDRAAAMSDRARAMIAAQQGATRRTVDALAPLMRSDPSRGI